MELSTARTGSGKKVTVSSVPGLICIGSPWPGEAQVERVDRWLADVHLVWMVIYHYAFNMNYIQCIL